MVVRTLGAPPLHVHGSGGAVLAHDAHYVSVILARLKVLVLRCVQLIAVFLVVITVAFGILWCGVHAEIVAATASDPREGGPGSETGVEFSGVRGAGSRSPAREDDGTWGNANIQKRWYGLGLVGLGHRAADSMEMVLVAGCGYAFMWDWTRKHYICILTMHAWGNSECDGAARGEREEVIVLRIATHQAVEVELFFVCRLRTRNMPPWQTCHLCSHVRRCLPGHSDWNNKAWNNRHRKSQSIREYLCTREG